MDPDQKIVSDVSHSREVMLGAELSADVIRPHLCNVTTLRICRMRQYFVVISSDKYVASCTPNIIYIYEK